jgi:hypothetical protein
MPAEESRSMNTCPDLLEALKQRERDLELDACTVKAKIEEIRLLINMVEHPRKRLGRPRKPDVQVVHDATPALFTHNDDDNGGTAA